MTIFYKKSSCFFLLIVLILPINIQSAFLLFDSQALLELKNQIAIHNEAFESSYLDLIREAEGELLSGPYSLMDKKLTPQTGDKHDYLSLARYYWPDPNQDDSLPYIEKDCEVNPDIFKDEYDNAKKCQMIRACIRLCLAYYLSNDEKYAVHATHLIKIWFLDPKSCMNPNLNFAQVQPGITNQNHFGIIEGHTFPYLFEALNFLEGSSSWTSAETQGMDAWATDYLEWLLYSHNGIRARHTFNNHSSWYDAQVLYFSLYTHQEHFAADYMEEFTVLKLKTHFAKDYSQPHEMVRKKNFFYSVFNLQALYNCVLLGRHINKDLWEIQHEGSRTLQKGLDFLLLFLENQREWERGCIERSDFSEIGSLLLIATTIYNDVNYLNLYEKVEFLTRDLSDSNKQISHKLFRLLYPKPFILCQK